MTRTLVTRLALTSLDLSHFRSHKLTSLTFSGAPVAIFGANGVGKTNILEAISMLSPGRGLRRAAAEDLARAPDPVGWRIKAELTSLGRTHEVDTRAEPGTGRSVRIDGKTASQIALGRLLRMVWLVPVMDRLWVDGAAERRRFLDRVTLSFFPDHAEASIAYEKAMRDRNRLLKDQVRDASWYRALEGQMARHGAKVIASRQEAVDRLMAAQVEATSAFPQAELAIISNDDAPPEQSEDSLLDAFQDGRSRDMAAGRTLTGPHRADLHAIYAAKGVEAKLCSTGEQKALLISLVLANGRAIADEFGAAPLLLLDEVAAHLDADRRAALFDEICDMQAQAFMTGTGAELFEGLGARAQWFEVSDGDGASTVMETAP